MYNNPSLWNSPILIYKPRRDKTLFEIKTGSQNTYLIVITNIISMLIIFHWTISNTDAMNHKCIIWCLLDWKTQMLSNRYICIVKFSPENDLLTPCTAESKVKYSKHPFHILTRLWALKDGLLWVTSSVRLSWLSIDIFLNFSLKWQ